MIGTVPQIPDDLWGMLPLPLLMLDVTGRITDSNAAAQAYFHQSVRRLNNAFPDQIMEISPPLSGLVERFADGKPSIAVNDMKLSFRNRSSVFCRLQITRVGNGFMLLFQPSETDALPHTISAPDSSARAAVGMADMLAHEIKNPLAGISGAAQLIEMSGNGDTNELTELIVDECQRIVKLLSQVEEFGNLLPPESVPVNLHDVLDRAVHSASLGFASGITMVRQYDPSLPLTCGDADRLVQVFLNLLKNAAEALGRSDGNTAPQIVLRSFYEQGLRRQNRDGCIDKLPLQIEITDNGPGIPEHIVDEIFDPFVSGRQNGTGLGLPLVNHIIEAHRGLVRVTSQPGRTSFRISLPVAQIEAETEAEKLADTTNSLEGER